ncbi:hypothetical protein VE03_04712 [Pseudogymnoascus sp. 23342-1-I1]|nr:hypothetical protein VE03_04712 [Pseudogymnoascus sp. 23342-1-I1]
MAFIKETPEEWKAEEAEKWLLRVVEAGGKLLWGRHPDILRAELALGMLYVQWGREAEAEPKLQIVVLGRQRYLGVKSDATQDSKEVLLPFCDANGAQASQFSLSSRRLSTFSSDVKRGVLSPRGWTLQERVLAPRTLHFGKSQLHWECRTSIWNERTDFTRIFYTPHESDDAREIIKAMNRKKLGIPSGRDMVGIGAGCTEYTMWYDLVSDYSCRKLTFPEDRLRALLGLAELFREIVRDRFVWGLWHRDLPAGLLWSIQAPVPTAKLAAPSWSWASIDGELTFYIPSTKWGRRLRGNLEVTCDSISLTGSVGPHGTHQSGQLSCLCPVQLVALFAIGRIEENEEHPYDHLRHQPNSEVRDVGNGHVIGIAFLDDNSLLGVPDPLNPLKLHAAMFYRQHPISADRRIENNRKQVSLSYCILLKPLVENGLFQRCGYAEIEPKVFSGVEMSSIAII